MIPWKHRIEPYEKQRQAIFEPEGNAIVLASPKAGKAQPLDSLVFTPTGPVPMGKLQVGDEVLTADGGRTRITGIFPQGVQPVYRVWFSDGQYTECTLDHLWEIHIREDRGADWPRVAPLSDVVGLSDDYHKRCWIPTADPVDYDPQSVPIDPYLLGVLIGDGALKYGIGVSLPDDYIRERVEAAIPDDHSLVFRSATEWAIITRTNWTHHPDRMHVKLRDLGLYGKGSPEKFIPDIYKYNSVEVRMEMLRGLLDTDGWVDDKGQPHFDSSSKQLCDDARELIEGLGGFAYYRRKPVPGYLDSHQLTIVHPNAPTLFSLPRKRDATRPKIKPTRRKFRQIELVRRTEVQCIKVADSRGLYLADHMITTHNTISALQWLVEETEKVSRPHARFLWVAPVYSQAKIAFRRCYTEMLDLEQINVHKTDHTVTLPDESVIVFGSADRADNIFGDDYFGVVFDEATRSSLESWVAVTSTTQHTAARMRLIGNNTRRPNWAKKLAIKARKGELPGWTYTKLERQDAIDAGVIDSAQDEMTKLLIPEDEYRVLYEGADVDAGGIHLDTYRMTVEPVPEFVLKVRAWDLASTAGGDYTVGALIEANSEGYWLTDLRRERRNAEDVPELVAEVALMDGPSVDQVFEEERGSSGMIVTAFMTQMLSGIPGSGPVWPARVESNKRVRAWPFVAQTQAGRFHLAPGFSHAEAMVEMDEWPDSANDDVVDAIAHGVNHLSSLVEGMIGSSYVPGRD